VHGTFAGSVSGDDAAKELTIDGRKIKVGGPLRVALAHER
jgi:hypothetical protein